MDNLVWLFKMSYRDGRKNLSRLFLFSLSVIIGIASLVAIRSFSDNLQAEIGNQARSILGADLVITSTQPLETRVQKFLGSIGKNVTREISFTSMLVFPKSGLTRLCQVRAVEREYPFYGNLETSPVNSFEKLFKKQSAMVLPDELLILQYKLSREDLLKIGDQQFHLAGSLLKIPGQAGFASGIAPVVFIPYTHLKSTHLLQKGSRISYKFYYKFPEGTNISSLVKKLKPRLDKEHLRVDTVEMTKTRTTDAYKNLTQYLNLVSFIALLLGAIGVSSSVQIYIKEKIAAVAILRCLGASSNQTFTIYLLQIIVLGLGGAIIGALLGTILQLFLPAVFKEFLTVVMETNISWTAIFQGIAVGLIIALLFGLLPLLEIRNVSPLNTLRASYIEKKLRFNILVYFVYFLIVLFIICFAYLQTGDLGISIVFSFSILAGFILLAGTALLLMKLLRLIDFSAFSFIVKQGIANLFRPDNQTLVMMLSIGLGTALISTLFLIQNILLQKVNTGNLKDQPNLIVFDIQPLQKLEVLEYTKSFNLKVIQTVPIVTMRLESINGQTKSLLDEDSTGKLPAWIFNREYRVTFRDSLVSSETLLIGKLYTVSANVQDTAFISVEEGFAKSIHAGIGDGLSFNVQGAIIHVKIGSIRKVDWRRVQTNFILLFPTGILEGAPTFFVMSTRTPDKKISAAFQNSLVARFPNISVIDLTQILVTLKEVLSKISFVVQFMAFFSIATGIIVIIGSVRMSKYQRMKENILLRTLGAGRSHILGINIIEYFILGLIGTLTGVIFSMVAAWGFARFLLESPLIINWIPLLFLIGFIPLITMVIGLLNIGSIIRKPPLEILRTESN